MKENLMTSQADRTFQKIQTNAICSTARAGFISLMVML